MRKLVAFLLLVLSASNIFAQDLSKEKRIQEYNLESDRVAIQGFDPVAYFTANKAVEGKKEHSYTHKGVTYHFSSAKNLNAFKANPDQYEPQYGGWCAYALGATGKKVAIDPETFKLVDGKLYLFYNQFFNNTKKDWDKDEKHLKSQADANWKKIIR